MARGRAVWSARLVHTQEVEGSNPSPATSPEFYIALGVVLALTMPVLFITILRLIL